MGQIIEVAYADKYHPGEFTARSYAYWCDHDVKVGEHLVVPAGSGTSHAVVTATGKTVEDVPERVRPFLKAIEEIVRPEVAAQ
jgi:hypothetical protein